MRSTPRNSLSLDRANDIGAELRKWLASALVFTVVVAFAPQDFAHADLAPPIPNETPKRVVQLFGKNIWPLVHAERNYVLIDLRTGEEGTFSTDGKTIKMDWYFKSTDRPVILNDWGLCIKSDAGIMKCMSVWAGPTSFNCRYTLIEVKDDRQVCLRELTP